MIAQELEVSLHMAFMEARQKRHEFITVEHLLLALLDNPSAAEVLRACAANLDDLRKMKPGDAVARRGDGHATSLTKIRFDDIAIARLKEQGYEAESVPPKGARVILRNNANLSTGGTAIDQTDVCHPDNREMAIRAAAFFSSSSRSFDTALTADPPFLY